MNENAKAALDKVLEKFKSGDIPAVIADCVRLRIPASWPSSKWSLINRTLAYAQAGTLNAWCELPVKQISESKSRASELEVEEDQEITLVGLYNRLEVWNPSEWRRYITKTEDKYEQNLGKILNLL